MATSEHIKLGILVLRKDLIMLNALKKQAYLSVVAFVSFLIFPELVSGNLKSPVYDRKAFREISMISSVRSQLNSIGYFIGPRSDMYQWMTAKDIKIYEKSEHAKVPIKDDQPNETFEIIFEDNFDLDNQGWGNLHYRGFRKWYITKGEVDLVGSGFRYEDSMHNLYVDLSGTAYSEQGSVSGQLQSKEIFVIEAGTYILQFDLACRPKPIVGEVHVRLANVFDEYLVIDSLDYCKEFDTESSVIEVSKPTKGRLMFEYRGQTWGDVLLDNVRLVRRSKQLSPHDNMVISEHKTKTANEMGRPSLPTSNNEEIKQVKTTEILQSISEVDVETNTETLNDVMNKLAKICEKAVETQNALLQVKYGAEKSLNSDN
jgi:hypothetical protein